MDSDSFVFQWHITERCNWRCTHCYQESYDTREMKLSELFRVRDEFINFLNSFKKPPRSVHIQITGGEPFVRPDILEFLAGIAKHKDKWTWSVMSNGSLLNKEMVKFLKSLGLRNFQVSMEGMEKKNDAIRGAGAFKKTIKAIELLTEAGIPTRVSLTLSRKNMEDVFPLAKFLSPLGAQILAARRIVPWGQGKQMERYLLEPQELYALYRKIEDMNRWLIDKKYNIRVRGGCESGFFFEDVIHHPETGEELMTKNNCGVFDGRLLVVMPDGAVLPCRRLPIPVGKLFDQTLREIWDSHTMKAFRDSTTLTKAKVCRTCTNWDYCKGGAPCVNYGFTGKLSYPDIQCPKAFSSLNEVANYSPQ